MEIKTIVANPNNQTPRQPIPNIKIFQNCKYSQISLKTIFLRQNLIFWERKKQLEKIVTLEESQNFDD